MALFRRKKKVVKPTSKEKKEVTAQLQHKYPQMYTPIGWSKTQRKVYSRATPADQREIAKITGLTLKRKYKKK